MVKEHLMKSIADILIKGDVLVMYEELLLSFRTGICNECGEVVVWCDELTDEQVQKLLNDHEEYYLNCIQI